MPLQSPESHKEPWWKKIWLQVLLFVVGQTVTLIGVGYGWASSIKAELSSHDKQIAVLTTQQLDMDRRMTDVNHMKSEFDQLVGEFRSEIRHLGAAKQP